MQQVDFNFWTYLFSALWFLATCNGTTSVQNVVNETTPSVSQVTLPKDEGPSAYANVQTKLTLILLKEGKVYAYEGLDIAKGTMYPKGEARRLILAAKQKFPKNEFVVVMKPTKETDYTTTVDLLDEMTINKVDHYSIEQLTDREKKTLNVKDKTEN